MISRDVGAVVLTGEAAWLAWTPMASVTTGIRAGSRALLSLSVSRGISPASGRFHEFNSPRENCAIWKMFRRVERRTKTDGSSAARRMSAWCPVRGSRAWATPSAHNRRRSPPDDLRPHGTSKPSPPLIWSVADLFARRLGSPEYGCVIPFFTSCAGFDRCAGADQGCGARRTPRQGSRPGFTWWWKVRPHEAFHPRRVDKSVHMGLVFEELIRGRQAPARIARLRDTENAAVRGRAGLVRARGAACAPTPGSTTTRPGSAMRSPSTTIPRAAVAGGDDATDHQTSPPKRLNNNT